MSAARFGVYVHFPFCLSKCPYCDFASVAARAIPEEAYTAAILRELAARVKGRTAREVDSIYFGGGTPSLWRPALLKGVLDALTRTFTVSPRAEVTLEANPGASDAERFAAYREAGVNRLSIGVQSFQASTLATLGRAHDAPTARRAFAAARAAGFDNVSLDFIYGVHGQSLEQVRADAEEAASLGPEHLSAYALTLDRDSLAEEVPLARQLARGEVTLPDDEVVVEMQRAVARSVGRAGLQRYEVSNYAKPGFHSRHNTLYWTGGEYLALGCGATGFLREPAPPIRYTNHRSPERYLSAGDSLPEASRERLGPRELFEERLAMGLRLSSGVDLEAVCAELDEDAAPRQAIALELERAGLVERAEGRLRLTARGFDVHSGICAKLL